MKQSHRIIRDVSLVVVFCGGFLALIWFANSLQDTSPEETNSEFSQYRIEADTASQERNLDVSLENLRSLVAKDPYDGRAQYRLAMTLFSKIIEAQADTDSDTPEASDSAQKENSVAQRLPDLQEKPAASQDASSNRPAANDDLRPLVDQAIHEYQLAAKHARYRLRSQFQLALLWSAKGDYEAAFDSLDRFVTAGGVTRNGLDQIEQFGQTSFPFVATKLHADPRFIDLVDREFENRITRTGNRGFENNSRPQRPFNRHRLGSTITRQNPFPTVMRPDTNMWNFLKRLNRDLIPYRIKLVDFIRVLLKKFNVVVRDHDDLEIQFLRGPGNDVNQSWHQLWPQPTILFVQNQKPTMLVLVQPCQSKQSQPDAQHVLN